MRKLCVSWHKHKSNIIDILRDERLYSHVEYEHRILIILEESERENKSTGLWKGIPTLEWTCVLHYQDFYHTRQQPFQGHRIAERREERGR